MQRILALTVLLATAVSGFASPLVPVDPEKQANAFARIYATFCLKHINEIDKLRDSLAFSPRIPPDEAKKLLRGQAGEAWPVPEDSGRFILAILKEKNVCMVYGLKADSARVEKTFSAIANAAPSPMITRTLQDERLTTPFGPARSMTYEWSMSTAAAKKVILSLTTTASDTAPLQALASAAMIAK